jgi:hypothetical protein
MSHTVSEKTMQLVAAADAARRRRRVVTSIAGVGLVAAVSFGGWWYVGHRAKARERETAQAIATQVAQDMNFQRVREAVDAGEVSRDAMREAMGDAMRQRMEKVVDDYFALPESQREKYLDQQIDEFERMRQRWESERANRPSTQPGATPGEGRDGRGPRADGERPTTQEMEQRREEMRQRMAERMANTPPDRRAKMAEFFAAMQKRRAERGLPEMRGFGGRGFGGGGWGGGGWGGGGGNPGGSPGGNPGGSGNRPN